MGFLKLISLLFLTISPSIIEARLRSAAVPLGDNPGLIVRLRKQAIDSVVDQTTNLVAKYSNKVPVPPFAANIGGVDFEIKNTQISQLDVPQITYTLTSPDKISGQMHLPSFGAQADFHATRNLVGGGKQEDSGLVMFNATDVKTTVDLTLGQFDNGVPNVADFKCQATLGPANLKVQGAKEKFAVEVLQVAAKTIRPLYETQVCGVAKKLVNDQINRILAKIPNVLEVNPEVAIKYQVKPVVGTDFVEVQIFEKLLTDEASPFNPAPFQEEPNDKAMVVILLSDALVNDGLYQAYTNKLMDLTIDPSSPAVLYNLTRLECNQDQPACLGNVIPTLVEKYGKDATVKVTAKATKAPELEFLQDKATFKSAMTASLDFTPKGGQETHEATATLDINGSVQVKIHENRLYGKVTVEHVEVTIDQPDAQQYAEKVQETIKEIVENHVNGDLLLKGLPLKLPFGLGVTDPCVKIAPHTLQAHTAFDLKVPGSGESEETPSADDGAQADAPADAPADATADASADAAAPAEE